MGCPTGPLFFSLSVLSPSLPLPPYLNGRPPCRRAPAALAGFPGETERPGGPRRRPGRVAGKRRREGRRGGGLSRLALVTLYPTCLHLFPSSFRFFPSFPPSSPRRRRTPPPIFHANFRRIGSPLPPCCGKRLAPCEVAWCCLPPLRLSPRPVGPKKDGEREGGGKVGRERVRWGGRG